MERYHLIEDAQEFSPQAAKYSNTNHQDRSRPTLNDHPTFEKLRQLALTPEQHAHLFGLIAATFKTAVDGRSPKNRPPGKAGLRAEKGYYRLLYLEGALHEKINADENKNPDAPSYNWDAMIDIMRQLTDTPELRSEIMAGLERALDEIAGPTQTGN
jgi:hypothetical protein